MTTTIDDILSDARKCQDHIAELRDRLADEEKRLEGFKAEAIRLIEAKLASTPRKLPRNTRKAAIPTEGPFACPDCGAPREKRGHMTCSYPVNENN